MTDLPFDYADTAPANPAAPQPQKCRRHVPVERDGLRVCVDSEVIQLFRVECARCGKMIDPAASRRGRTNRSRGNAIEREIGHRLGLRRVGQYGGPDDLTGELFAVQVKSGGAFSERYWAWLKAVPANAGQTPLLVVTDAPGPGRRRRAVVVLDLEEWIALHGPVTP